MTAILMAGVMAGCSVQAGKQVEPTTGKQQTKEKMCIRDRIKRVLVKYGMSEEKAETCARIHTETTYDGVYSHGTNRVARFVN